MPTDMTLDEYTEALAELDELMKKTVRVGMKFSGGSRRERAIWERIRSLCNKMYSCCDDIENASYHYFPDMDFDDSLRLEDARNYQLPPLDDFPCEQ